MIISDSHNFESDFNLICVKLNVKNNNLDKVNTTRYKFGE